MTSPRRWRAARQRCGLIFLCAAALALLADCAARRELSPTETRLQVIRAAIEQNNDELISLSGRAQVVVESPHQSFSGEAVVKMLKPDSLYVRIEALLGMDVGVLAADRRRFVIFAPTEKTAYFGGSTDTLRLAALLGFDMAFDQLMRVVSGTASIERLHQAAVRTDDDNLMVTGRARQMHYEYTVNSQFGAVTRLVLRDPNGAIVRVEEYKQFMRRGNVRLPRYIRLMRPAQKESLTLYYQQIAVNVPLQPSDFSVKLPTDVIKVRL